MIAEGSGQVVVIVFAAACEDDAGVRHVEHLLSGAGLSVDQAVSNVVLPVQDGHAVLPARVVLQHHRVVDLVEEVPGWVLLEHGVVGAHLQRLVLVRRKVVASLGVDVGQVSRQLLVIGVLERVYPLLLAQIDELAVQLVVLWKFLPLKKSTRSLIEVKLLFLIRLPVFVALMAFLKLPRPLVEVESIGVVIVKIVEPLPPPPLPPVVLLLLKAIVPDIVLHLQIKHHLLCLEIVVLLASHQEVVLLAIHAH